MSRLIEPLKETILAVRESHPIYYQKREADMSIRNDVIEMIQNLPDDSSFDDVYLAICELGESRESGALTEVNEQRPALE